MMRKAILGIGGFAATLAAAPASAVTIVVFTDPMTLEQRTVVLNPNGPDRAYLCVLPPATIGCQAIPVTRRRS